MEGWLLAHGYPALFLLSFLAATLVPVGSEWLLGALLLKGFDPVWAVGVATTGNTLGALTTYAIGLWGGPFLIERLLRVSAAERRRAENWFARYGSWALLGAWLPLIGDGLCLLAGLLRVGGLRFLVLVAVGKFGRYLLIALAVGRVFGA